MRLLEKHDEGEFVVGCNFIVYRTRLAMDEDLWVGRREDTLRKVGGGWKIARREIMKYPSVNEFPGAEDAKEAAEEA